MLANNVSCKGSPPYSDMQICICFVVINYSHIMFSSCLSASIED